MSSTSLSRAMSSEARRLRERQGLPSGPRRILVGLAVFDAVAGSMISSPCRRRRAMSVASALRRRASSPRSISWSLPMVAGWRCMSARFFWVDTEGG